jgi:hypothetical protein
MCALPTRDLIILPRLLQKVILSINAYLMTRREMLWSSSQRTLVSTIEINSEHQMRVKVFSTSTSIHAPPLFPGDLHPLRHSGDEPIPIPPLFNSSPTDLSSKLSTISLLEIFAESLMRVLIPLIMSAMKPLPLPMNPSLHKSLGCLFSMNHLLRVVSISLSLHSSKEPVSCPASPPPI